MTAGLVLAAGASGPAVAAVTGPASGASVASRASVASVASGALAAAAARTPAAQAAVAAASPQRMYNSGNGLYRATGKPLLPVIGHGHRRLSHVAGLRREHRDQWGHVAGRFSRRRG